MAADAVVLGEIEAVAYIDTPSVQSDGSVAADCENGTVKGAIELTLIDVQSLRGDVDDSISFRIGTEQLNSWTAIPVPAATGGVSWQGVGALVPGQQVGAALHFSAKDALWSLMGEALFGVAAAGTVEFQDPGEICADPAPRSIDHAALTTVKTTLATCQPSAAADDRRTHIEMVWGGSPEYYMLGYCIPDELLDNPGGCRSDSECSTETVCVSGRCQAP